MDEVYKFLKELPTFYLATVEGDQPRVRPFGAIIQLEGKLWLVTSSKKPVYQQVARNPKAEMSGTDKDGNWIRVQTTLVAEDNRAAKVQLLEEYPTLKAVYAPDDDHMTMLSFNNTTATFCSFTSQPRAVTF
ncbi:MAG: pyridoxamine 5'-phosphate oxidase family protein [Ruminococcaceae bacterium]|nr:pyridoxamine 5'-phosphate oxidase family protein [Oscillospiraceae bacterium]